MTTAAKANQVDWGEYDQQRPRIVIRMSPAEKEAIHEASKRQGLNMSDMVLAYMRPVLVAGSAEGQRAQQIISNIVQGGIAWNRDEHGGGPGQGAVNNGLVPWYGGIDSENAAGRWASLPKPVELERFTMPDGASILFHRVRQREGMTRHQAVMHHVDQLLELWADLPSDTERESMLDELANRSRHRFAIVYVNLGKWRTFPSEYELGLHYKWFGSVHEATPETDEEQRFYDWAVEHLRGLWKQRSKANKDGVITLAADGKFLRLIMWHYPQPMMTDADNIERWARIWVWSYRNDFSTTGPLMRFDTLREYYQSCTLEVHRLSIEN